MNVPPAPGPSYRDQLIKQAQESGNFAPLTHYFQSCLTDEKLSLLCHRTGMMAEYYQKLYVGYDTQAQAWSFPERGIDGEVTGIMLRLEHPYKDESGKTVSKISIPGSKRGLTMRWPLDSYDGSSPHEPILLVEGQTDTTAGLNLGFVTVGRPSAHPIYSMIDLMCSLFQRRHIVVVAENDKSGAGIEGAKDTAMVLFGHAESIKIIRPPAVYKDLREWCIAGLTKDHLLNLIHIQRPYKPDSRDIIGSLLPKLDKPAVLVPDTHYDAEGRAHEFGNDQFTDEVLAKLPEGLIYRMGNSVGQVIGDAGQRRFVPLKECDIRLMVDEHLRLTRLTQSGGGEKRKSSADYVNCANDHAKLILAAGVTHPDVPEIKMLVSFPAFTWDWQPSQPGYMLGLYYDEPPELFGLEPIRDHQAIKETLEDLVIDFPFAGEADRQNLYGLLLTPLIRWAIQDNVPLHLVMAPLERTGKTKLVEQVFGGLMLGRAGLPAMQLPKNEEETEKRVLAVLLQGQTLLNLDNIRAVIDSASLASLLTARTFTGRVLGHSQTATLPNHLTLVGTGNNVTASGEIAKRSVPIYLQPATANPEDRDQFNHTDLPAYIASVRRHALACLIGMVLNWIKAGRPQSNLPLGGFEQWAHTVGGILNLHGFTAWRTNERDWRRTADPFGEDRSAFIEHWRAMHRDTPVAPKTLLALAERHSLFTDLLAGKGPQGKLMAFARKVLSPLENCSMGPWVVRRRKSGNNTTYLLEESPLAPQQPNDTEQSD